VSEPSEARKYFFFKKNKQKTFARWLTRQERSARTETNKSFLVLFFKKELLSFVTCLKFASAVTGRSSLPSSAFVTRARHIVAIAR